MIARGLDDSDVVIFLLETVQGGLYVMQMSCMSFSVLKPSQAEGLITLTLEEGLFRVCEVVQSTADLV